MRLLIVEDDENKRQKLVDHVGPRCSSILHAASYHSAMDVLETAELDLVILDMTIPTFDIVGHELGGRPQAYGGREILEQLDLLDRPPHVIVVTQFDHFGDQKEAMSLKELDEQLSGEFGDSYVGVVYYNSSRDGWRKELMRLLDAVKKRTT